MTTTGTPPLPDTERPADRSRGRRTLTVIGLVVVGLLLVAGAAAAAVVAVESGEVLPHVRVAGVDVGGLGPDDARAALDPVVTQRLTEPVVFTFEDREFTFDPAAQGYDVDLDATVEAAMQVGRDDAWYRDLAAQVVAPFADPREIDLVDSVDDTTVERWVEDIRGRVDRPPSVGDLQIDPATLEVTAVAPVDGAAVRPRQLRERLRTGLRTAGAERYPLPVEMEPAPVTLDAVEAVAAQARNALAGPLTLTGAGATAVLEPPTIASMLDLTARPSGDGTVVELTAPVQAVEAALAPYADAFSRAPVNADFQVNRAPPVRFDDKNSATWTPKPVAIPVTPSTPGLTFDAGIAAEQLTELFRQGAREAPLRLREVPAEFTTQDAEAFQLTHLLGTFTTYHSCCQNRVRNIQRLADMVDGTRVGPGEQFSINQISGTRTCGKGFVKDGMILQGEIVPVCGGGVSQFGTTTLNAAFFAATQIDDFKPHSFYISRYPMGREATLNYPSPDIDVRFTNTTDAGMLVKTSYTGTSITVSIYGKPNFRSVQAVLGSTYNHTRSDTRRREVDDLPLGEERVVQEGSGGFSVQVTRVIERLDGSTDRRVFTTVYVPKDTIIEENTGGRAEPRPEL